MPVLLVATCVSIFEVAMRLLRARGTLNGASSGNSRALSFAFNWHAAFDSAGMIAETCQYAAAMACRLAAALARQ